MAENASGCYPKIEIVEERVFFSSIFNKWDKNGNGAIEEGELRNKLREEYDEDITSTEINYYMNGTDENKDGRINLDEFMAMYCKYKKLFGKCIDRYVNLFVTPTDKGLIVQLQRKDCRTGKYEDLSKFKKTTVVMILLSILQVILYFTPWKDRLIFKHNERFHMWRYVSYMFTHNDDLHLTVTVLTQLIVGIPLEMVNGWRVLIIYLAGILGGSLFQSVIYPLEDLAGGSPGVYAILTSHISKIILNFREYSQSIPYLIAFGIYTALNTIYNYFTYWNYHETSYISHLGGAICGFLVGISVLINVIEEKYEIVIWWICMVLYVIIMLSLIGLEFDLGELRHHKD